MLQEKHMPDSVMFQELTPPSLTITICFEIFFRSPRERKNSHVQWCYNERTLMWNYAFPKSLFNGALQVSFLPPVLHLRFDGQKKNSE